VEEYVHGPGVSLCLRQKNVESLERSGALGAIKRMRNQLSRLGTLGPVTVQVRVEIEDKGANAELGLMVVKHALMRLTVVPEAWLCESVPPS
jgi:hypothetical protein